MNKFLCPPPDRLSEVRRVCASIQNLARTLGGRVLVPSGPEHEREFTLMVASMQLESFKERLAALDPQHLLVIVGDRVRIQKMALEARVAVLIVSGNNDVPPELIEAAQRAGVSLLVSPHDSATTALLCRAAITVEHMVHEQFLSFQDDELLEEVQAMATASHFHVFPVLDSEKQTIGILSKSDFLKKPDRKLILVDHNELSQAVPGADQVEILEIIDHHRLGALTTTQPILFRNEPVGSTSTIVAECFFRNQVELSKNLAGLLLAGLVSDTLNLTSPTSTERDGQILRRLEKISGVNAGSFLEKLFASGSVLTSSPPDEAILADCKEFAEQGQTFSAAQIEEVGFETFWKRKDELFEALERHRARKKYFFAVLLVTDVSRKSSLMLVAGPPALQRTIDQPLLQPGVFEMPGFVSRKKQLLPYLADCLKKLGTVRVTAEPVTMV
jgi:manganese-dependent inorganic pyrophosphatase